MKKIIYICLLYYFLINFNLWEVKYIKIYEIYLKNYIVAAFRFF